ATITDLERRSEAWDVLEPIRAMLEDGCQRGGIEKVLGDAVVEKAPKVRWPRIMYEAHLADPD
ncbi:hypothetical protein BDU57DRAFT_403051, partial [Ampelomyces quisqualis]